MGVAMHVIGDTYAHKSYALYGTTWVSYGSYPEKGIGGKDGKFEVPKQDGTYNRADDINCCKDRFICAKEACSEVLAVWNGIDFNSYSNKLFNLSFEFY